MSKKLYCVVGWFIILAGLSLIVLGGWLWISNGNWVLQLLKFVVGVLMIVAGLIVFDATPKGSNQEVDEILPKDNSPHVIYFILWSCFIALSIVSFVVGIQLLNESVVVGFVPIALGVYVLKYWVATLTCPECRGRVSYKATKCNHCCSTISKRVISNG